MVTAMKWQKMYQQNAQTLIEYAMVAAIVVVAVIAMSTYVFRSIQGTQQAIHQEFQDGS